MCGNKWSQHFSREVPFEATRFFLFLDTRRWFDLSTQQRLAYLDRIRAVAIICVVINHAFEIVCPMSVEHLGEMYLKARTYYIAGFTLGRMGVPLFFLLTGYLLLSRDFTEEGVGRFYKHNFIPLLLIWEIWILIYQLFLSVFYSQAFDFVSYFHRSLFLKHAGLPHTWYMPVILGIYLFIPFVSRGLKGINTRCLFVLLLLVYFHYFFTPSIPIFFNTALSGQLDLSFSGGTYGLYLVLGYSLAKFRKQIDLWLSKRISWLVLIFLLSFSYGITVLAQLYSFSMLNGYAVWYDFFTMPIMGVSLFLLLKKLDVPSLQWIENKIAICSFGIFLIHEPVLLVLNRYLKSQSSNSIKTAVLFICTFSISYCLVRVSALIPRLSILFLIKGQINRR